jgi:hypothetical protein
MIVTEQEESDRNHAQLGKWIFVYEFLQISTPPPPRLHLFYPTYFVC